MFKGMTPTQHAHKIANDQYSSEIVKTIETDRLVEGIFEALDKMDAQLIEKIRALKRAAQIASAYEDWALHSNSFHS